MKCFVIMPFSETRHKDRDGNERVTVKDEWTHIFNNWIKKAVESYPDKKLTCIRSGATPGNFIKGIVQDINSCELVIADLTGQKPNVYYELGIRHALRLGTITISQDLKAVPSDLLSYYCFEYTYESAGFKQDEAYKKFEEELHEKIKHILANPLAADNPVADFVNIEQYVREEQIKLKQKRFIELVFSLIEMQSDTHEKVNKILAQKDTYIKLSSLPPCIINPDLFSAQYTSIITGEYDEIMGVETFKKYKAIFRDVANLYYLLSQVWISATISRNQEIITKSLALISETITDVKVQNLEKLKEDILKFEKGEITFEKFIQ